MIWSKKKSRKGEREILSPDADSLLEELIHSIEAARTDVHYPNFCPYFWRNYDFYDSCYIALRMCHKLKKPVGAIQVLEKILSVAGAFRKDLKGYRLLSCLHLAKKWYQEGLFLPYSEEELSRIDYPIRRNTKLLLQAFEEVGMGILDPQLHLAHAAYRWGNFSNAVRIIQVSLNEEERDLHFHRKGKELPAYTCLAISKMFFYGLGIGRKPRRAEAWAQITLQLSTSEEVRLEAEQILASMNVMSSETPDFKLERMRLEHELKTAEVKIEQDHQASLKEKELAHRERITQIDADKEVEKARIEAENRIQLERERRESSADDVLKTHHTVVETLNLQIRKLAAEKEKYESMLRLQDKQQNEGSNNLGALNEILTKLKK